MKSHIIVIIAVLIVAFCCTAGCLGIGDIKDAISDLIQQTYDLLFPKNSPGEILDDGINRLTDESTSWQSVLEETRDNLIAAGQSTLANEVSNILNQAIHATGAEGRCDVDFIRIRVRQDLIRLKAEWNHQSIDPPSPYICAPVPSAIDMNLDPARRTKVDFYGFDFNASSKPTAVLKSSGGGTTDVSQHLSVSAPYQMVLNLGGTGVPLTSSSNVVVISWKGQDISQIPVIQPALPICDIKIESTNKQYVIGPYIPPHTRGDREFAGNGPRVSSMIRLSSPDHFRVIATVTMQAVETHSDWTTAYGTQTFSIYTAPDGYKILRINGPTSVTHAYLDDNIKPDFFQPGLPVRQLEYMGDTEGDDAGYDTGVTVTIAPFEVVLQRYLGCIP